MTQRGQVRPDMPAGQLIGRLTDLLARRPYAAVEPPDVDRLISDAVVQKGLFSWGRRVATGKRELIPAFAWEMGRFSSSSGTLTYRHPDSPLPEEFDQIEFNRAQIDRWLEELPGGAAR